MKKIYTKTYLTAIGLIISMAVFAQNPKVSGVIKDENGSELIGITVLEKGTTNGTLTDLNGTYTIQLTTVNPTLVFSFVGLKTEEIKVGSNTNIDLMMKEDVQQLQEVVVLGFGTQKKVNLSGAVDQIDPEIIEKRPISSVAQGLQGLVPNLNIDYMSGEPGRAANINIRGITNLSGGGPLILIDGVPSDAMELNRLAPVDIENISVIKDASASAIYGARAAFGVILITTKTGTEGMRITYSNNFSWDKPTVLPEKITDPYIFSRMLETSTDNTPWDNVNYSDEYYLYAKERSDNPEGTPGVRQNPSAPELWEYMGNRDWTEYFLDDFTTSTNHQLSLSGGTDKTSFLLSGSYNRQNGALKLADDLFDRYTVRNKVSYKPFDWLTFGNNTYLTNTKREVPSYFNVWDIYNFFPTSYDKNPDGSWANSPVGRLGSRLTNGGATEDRYSSFQTQFTNELSFFDKVFKVNTDFTYRRGTSDYNYYTTKYLIGYGPEDIREEGSNYAYRRSINEDYYVLNVYGTYNKEFGPHAITAIGGYNQEYYSWNRFNADRSMVISASLPTIALATGEDNVGESITSWAIRGAFYRLNYIFQDKYIIEFNGRYDGSSKFPQDKRFGFFPSYSASWILDRESFMSGILGPISLLKLRASYGSLGNQAVSSDFGYIATMNANNASYLIGGELPLRVSAPPSVSSNYTWEEVTTLNFGIDFGLFDDKILTTFDIYDRDTRGMLTQGRELPAVFGTGEPAENAADLETKGWELSINYRENIQVGGKPMNFNIKAVLSDSRSYISRFDNPSQSLTQFYEGMEFGEIWGLTSDGLFQTQEEIDALDESAIIPWGALSIVPGWPKYVDQDNNGLIEKGTTVSDPKDLSIIGNAAPRMRYGLNLGADWNGIDFSIFFQGIGKRDYYPLDYLYWGFYQQPYAGGATHLLDYYRANDQSATDRARHSQAYLDAGLADQNLDAEFPILQAWLADRNLGERIDQAQGLAIPQTGYLLNAAYLRLKNLTVGYTLPEELTSRAGLTVRVFVSGENLMEWSALKDYFDPEAINDDVAQLNPSVSSGRQVGSGYAYPFQRRYAFGINLTF